MGCAVGWFYVGVGEGIECAPARILVGGGVCCCVVACAGRCSACWMERYSKSPTSTKAPYSLAVPSLFRRFVVGKLRFPLVALFAILPIMRRREGTHSLESARGFTIVEVVVAVAIMALLTGIVLAGGGVQRAATQLLNEAYRVGALFRSAQTQGIGTSGVSGSFTSPYGVFVAPNSSEVIVFGDRNSDLWYEPGVDVVVERVALDRRFRIADVCGIKPGGSWECASGAPQAVQALVAVYQRPNPEAFIYTQQGGSQRTIGKVILEVRGSPKRRVEILVYLTGALEVAVNTP